MENGNVMCYNPIWRLASSEFEAIQLANEHAQYCGEVFDRPIYMTIADPDVFAQYILRGGVFPLNRQNIFGADYAFDIPGNDKNYWYSS
jgi:hypothetical protein